jgi:methyl-accepting chemotaxis protein
MGLKKTIGFKWVKQSGEFQKWIAESADRTQTLESKLMELGDNTNRMAEGAFNHASKLAVENGALMELAQSVENVSGKADQLTSSLNEVTESYKDLLSTVQRISGQSGDALKLVEEAHASMETIKDTIQGVAEHAENRFGRWNSVRSTSF